MISSFSYLIRTNIQVSVDYKDIWGEKRQIIHSTGQISGFFPRFNREISQVATEAHFFPVRIDHYKTGNNQIKLGHVSLRYEAGGCCGGF